MTSPAGSPAAAETRLREDAVALVRAALDAVDPADLTARALQREPPRVPRGGRLLVVAVGKAADPMARGAEGAIRAAGRRIDAGWILAPSGPDDDADGAARRSAATDGPRADGGAFRRASGGHPLPDARGEAAAAEILRALEDAGPSDRVLLLLSGGGSALLSLPAPGVTLDDLRRTTDLLLRAGAPIGDLNATRKHLERLKGGSLARAAHPAPVRALVLSDVVGDRLDVIASGPVSPDPTTFGDALAALERHGVTDRVPAAVLERLRSGRDGAVEETPGRGDPVFGGVAVEVVGNAALAAEAARREAARLGYAARVAGTDWTGEAREVGARLASLAREALEGGGGPAALLAAGETTVTVTGDGRGGRNQEVALGAALAMDGLPGALVLSVGTDGVDGPTDAAGALATGSTVERARSLGLDPAAALRRNDAHPFFDALGDLVRTGPTGTNVMDLMAALTRPVAPPG